MDTPLEQPEQSNLPPLPKKLDGFSEEITLSFPKCNHRGAKLLNGYLRCPCGACWQGPGIEEIYKILQS